MMRSTVIFHVKNLICAVPVQVLRSTFKDMRYLIPVIGLFFTLSPLQSQSLTTEQIEFDGLTRTYLKYIPAGFDEDNSLPLVMSFHGGAGNSLSSSMANLGGQLNGNPGDPLQMQALAKQMAGLKMKVVKTSLL